MVITFIKYVFVCNLLLMMDLPLASAQLCTYSTWSWNVHEKQAVDYRKVRKEFRELAPYERDAVSGCSVCEQDQTQIHLPGIKPFRVCKSIAIKLENSLKELLTKGEPIKNVIGYRVGMTRGPLDEKGNRTHFSNHSFGIAIDVNPEYNGLYTNCFQFSPQCKKIRGGDWRPGIDPLSLVGESQIVKTLKQIGFKWGGEIQGRQKDFMHFSISGY